MGYKILLSGTLSSGSSAVGDLLREYDSVVYPFEENSGGEFEFNNILSRPGMILSTALNPGANSAIDSFVEKRADYYREISRRRDFDLNPEQIDKEISALKLLHILNRNLKVELDSGKRLQLVHDFLESYKENYAGAGGHLVIDQPVFIENTSLIPVWEKIFGNFKWIIVYRNPKDQMAEIIRKGTLYKWYHEPKEKIYSGDRSERFRQHIAWIKMRMDGMRKVYAHLGKKSVLMISFEKLILEPEVSKNLLDTFLEGSLGPQTSPRKFLKPELSRKNIDFYSRYLCKKELDWLQTLQGEYEELEACNPAYIAAYSEI